MDILLHGGRITNLRSVILTLFLLLTSSLLQAQTTALTHYYQDYWTTLDGLPNNTIHAINQTAEGYLWFATWEGVARYNGHEFRNFSRSEESGLHGSAIRSLAVSEQGLLVGGARGSLSVYQDNTWTAQSKVSAMINQVLVDNSGLLWIATEGDGIYVRDGELTVAHFTDSQGLPSNYVYRLAQDKKGRVWAGTMQGLVRIFDNRVQLIPELAGLQVPALLVNDQGQLLIGTSAGLYQAGDTQAKGTQDKPPSVIPIYPKLAQQSILSLLEDEQQHLWLGTAEQGLFRISELGIENLTVSQGLPDHRVISLFQDKERSIWVGTHAGLMRLRDVPFISLTEQDGIKGNYVRTVLTHSDGSVWIGSSIGLTHIKNGQPQAIALTMPDGVAPSIASLAEGRKGELWVGTASHGLLKMVQGKITQVYNAKNGLDAKEIRALVVDEGGSVWIGSANGIYRLSQGQLYTDAIPTALSGQFIMSLHQTINGDLWAGMRNGVAIIRDGQVVPIDIETDHQAEYVFSFYSEPQGDYVWLATDMGLIRYRYADQSLRLIGKKQGLPIDKIFEMGNDHQGNLWLSSNIGMTRISLAAAQRVADGLQDSLEFEQYNERDGMASSQTHGSSNPGLSLDANGQIWVATAHGVTRMDPARLRSFSHAHFPVIIEDLNIDGKAVPLHSQLQLSAGSQRLQFSYAGLGFVMPERIEYRTLLEGFDNDWVLRGTQNRAEYTNLPPGDYVFRVAAAYSYQDWDEQAASVTFSVQPFIWQSPFFWAGIIALVLASLWLFIRVRLKLLTARAQELQREVSYKTQELQLQAEQLAEQAHNFERQARVDSLTELPNRRAFDEALACAFSRVRAASPLCLVVIDIDHFKRVNDTWSHAVGDQIIKIVAKIIRQQIRDLDIPARWGGEEFTLLLANTHLKDALPICERLRLAVMNYDYSEIDESFALTISLGLAQSGAGVDEQTLLANADRALYQAKRQGRNQVVIFTDNHK